MNNIASFSFLMGNHRLGRMQPTLALVHRNQLVIGVLCLSLIVKYGPFLLCYEPSFMDRHSGLNETCSNGGKCQKSRGP
jgi:hypothetical protein